MIIKKWILELQKTGSLRNILNLIKEMNKIFLVKTQITLVISKQQLKDFFVLKSKPKVYGGIEEMVCVSGVSLKFKNILRNLKDMKVIGKIQKKNADFIVFI